MNLYILVVVSVFLQNNGNAIDIFGHMNEFLKPAEEEKVDLALMKYQDNICDEHNQEKVQLECNSCVCMSGALMCTRMLCPKVPRDLWGHVELADEARSPALSGTVLGRVTWDLVGTALKNEKKDKVALTDIYAMKFMKQERNSVSIAVLKKPCNRRVLNMNKRFCYFTN